MRTYSRLRLGWFAFHVRRRLCRLGLHEYAADLRGEEVCFLCGRRSGRSYEGSYTGWDRPEPRESLYASTSGRRPLLPWLRKKREDHDG